MIEAWFDGVCEPRNPGGHAAWGAVVQVDGEPVMRKGGYCGVGPQMSNNVAEYSAFIAAITEAVKHPGSILVRGDSKLVICQLSIQPAGVSLIPGGGAYWKMRGGLYEPFYREAKQLLAADLQRWGPRIALEWIPREKNDLCDVLSKQQLHDRGVKFKIQPE